jgi:hypothetical protein
LSDLNEGHLRQPWQKAQTSEARQPGDVLCTHQPIQKRPQCSICMLPGFYLTADITGDENTKLSLAWCHLPVGFNYAKVESDVNLQADTVSQVSELDLKGDKEMQHPVDVDVDGLNQRSGKGRC